MQSVYQLFLAMTCAICAASVRSAAVGEPAQWRLESETWQLPLVRHRRQVFPGTGMPCLTVTFLTDMKGRFAERIDPNDDGKATVAEIRQYLRNFNPAVTDKQVLHFVTRRDLNRNGIVEFIPEYILDIATPDMTLDAASEWFALEDSDADGYVSRRELMRIAQHLGMTPQEADASVSSYYMTVDADGDDRLSFDEYKVLYGQ